MAGALIIAAEIGPPDQAWLDQLRRAHFPVERNQLPAHLTMFHALPPSSEREVRTELARITSAGAPPRASIEGLMDLGGGVAFRIVSADLDDVRDELARAFRGLLSAQDGMGWRPHITIQNKVSPSVARSLIATLQRDFYPRPIAITGVSLHRYLDGPWEKLTAYRFRGL
ncbi:MAG TPA: 2'-5' RNA ligase family protein [Sphingomicrobium sp.]|nr:2'-5' RNA ligase family protein [Sphingomicrobium sp.]